MKEADAFPAGDKRWWVYVDAGEWAFLYATSFSWMAAGVFPRGMRDLDEQMRFVLVDTHREHGYEWSGVVVDGAERLWRREEEPVEVRNAEWLVLIHEGIPPPIELILPKAWEWAGEHLPDFDTEPLRAAEARLERVLEEIAEQPIPPQLEEAFREAARKAREGAGEAN